MAGKSRRVLPFNSQAINKAGPLDGKQTEYRIDGERGLVLVVTAEGVGSYFFRYTVGHGKARKFRSEKIGRRDATSLHEARKRAGELRQAVGGGADPVADGDARKTAITFRALFEERLARDDSKAKRTLEDYKKALEADVFDAIGHLPAGEITGEQIARVLENVEARSKHAAHKARSAIGSTYRWAVKRRKVRSNPTIGLGFTVQSKPRNRVLSDDELKALWLAVDSGPGLSDAMRLILKLAILTGQRESEVAGALASELQLDTANPKWRIPSGRMKRKNREQIVPLSKQAVALFKQAVALANGSPYVFPADTARVRLGSETRVPHINGESVSRAMARLRERVALANLRGEIKKHPSAKQHVGDVAEIDAMSTSALLQLGRKLDVEAGSELDDARVHDLRKTVTTWLRENRLVSSDVCDLILHHARKGVTASHYDFSTLEGPVRKALQEWADHVAVIAGADKGEASNVHALVRA